MSGVTTKKELEKARQQLADLLVKREQVEIEIAKQKRKVAAWAELCEESDIADKSLDLDLGGLTDVCRTAMRASRKDWMTISEIQDAVKELGFPLHEYKAPAASITTTINRLAQSGEVISDKGPSGFIEYKHVGAMPKALRREKK
jgi:hypothetical protein